MPEFLKIILTFLSTAFSGFGNIICEKLFKNRNSKKHNKNKSDLSDKEIILHSINHDDYTKQREVFLRYFYKYKNHFTEDDVNNLLQKSEKDHPNYSNLLSILCGLIESIK